MMKIEKLKKTYNKGRRNSVCAVNNISLELPKTGMVALFGRSGCGKTTLLNILGGLDRADSGTVTVDDTSISPSENNVRNRKIGFIFQNYYLVDTISVEENVASSLRLCGLTDEKEIQERTLIALKAVGLEKYRRRFPQNLSGGQQQRVAIARAIVKNPEIILADEPTGNLDEANTVMVMDILREISKNTLVILVTHEAHLVDFYCDRLIEMIDGKIVSERENDTQSGYTAQGKNDVYLGDMQMTEGNTENLDFVLYSKEQQEKLSLSIISVGGVFYIKSNDPNAKLCVLDNSAELTVHEGSYSDHVEKRVQQAAEKMADIVSMPRITKGRTGRMYNAASGVRSAVRRQFAKKKSFRKALIATMFLLSAVFVFFSANCMTLFSDIEDITSYYSDNIIYVKTDLITSEALEEIKANSKLVFYANTPSSLYRQRLTVSFNGGYNSSSFFYNDTRSMNIFCSTILPIDIASNDYVLCGRKELKNDSEVVISSKTADLIISASKLSFVKHYEDIIGLKLDGAGTENSNLQGKYIVGIIENDQPEIYTSDETFIKNAYANLRVTPHSQVTDDTLDMPEKGTVYISSTYSKDYPINSKVNISGKQYTVVKYFESNQSYDDEKYYEDPIISNSASSEDIAETQSVYVSGGISSDVIIVQPGAGTSTALSYVVIMNDDDYTDVVDTVGSTDKLVTVQGMKDAYAIYPNDIKEMVSILQNYNIPRNMIYDSQTTYEYYYNYTSIGEEIVASAITFVVMILFISLCMFFIMRSSITSDVKEIGIYRAIGVSRKNIVFKYFVESNVIFFMTTFVGFALTTAVILAAGGGSTNGYLYLPWYSIVGLGAFLYVISIICGITPVLKLTRRSPAAIIAKYDI